MTDSLYGARVSMEPAGLELRYREAESGIQHTVEPDGFVPVEETTLSIEVSFDGEVLEMVVVPAPESVNPHTPVIVQGIVMASPLLSIVPPFALSVTFMPLAAKMFPVPLDFLNVPPSKLNVAEPFLPR